MKKPFPISGLCLLLFFAVVLAHGALQGRGTPSNVALEQGKKVYHANCGECHGSQGRGDGPKALKMGFHPRDFTLGAFKCADARQAANFRPMKIFFERSRMECTGRPCRHTGIYPCPTARLLFSM
jgi:hypothetical protein